LCIQAFVARTEIFKNACFYYDDWHHTCNTVQKYFEGKGKYGYLPSEENLIISE